MNRGTDHPRIGAAETPLDTLPAPDILPSMTSPITRPNLPDVVEKHLREAISRGDFREFLPGERPLAETFKVSRPTLRRALAALAAEGILRQQSGCATRILRTDLTEGAKPPGPARVIFLSAQPLHRLSTNTVLAFDMLGKKLSASGMELRFAECHAFLQNEFQRTLDSFLKSSPAGTYVLHYAPGPVQRHLAQKGIPCVVMGSPDKAAGLRGVDTDFAPAARHAMGELKRLGHAPERTVLALPKLELAGHAAITEAFFKAGGRPASVLRHPVDFEIMPSWIGTHVLPLLRAKNGPTALITGWPRFTVGLVSALGMRHGLAIPENLSVVCLADDPTFDMLIPSVSRYRRNDNKYVNRLAKIILDTASHRKPAGPLLALIEPDFIAGGTLAGPRRG